MTITGYYWNGINSYVIYQDKKGNTTMKKVKQ
jgi:hypothetical protein